MDKIIQHHSWRQALRDCLAATLLFFEGARVIYNHNENMSDDLAMMWLRNLQDTHQLKFAISPDHFALLSKRATPGIPAVHRPRGKSPAVNGPRGTPARKRVAEQKSKCRIKAPAVNGPRASHHSTGAVPIHDRTPRLCACGWCFGAVT